MRKMGKTAMMQRTMVSSWWETRVAVIDVSSNNCTILYGVKEPAMQTQRNESDVQFGRQLVLLSFPLRLFSSAAASWSSCSAQLLPAACQVAGSRAHPNWIRLSVSASASDGYFHLSASKLQ